MVVRSDANTMFDLCSDTESAKTIKQLLDVVDSLSARLRTGGLRSQQSASDVQALHKRISQLVANRGTANMRVYALKYQYKTKHAQEEFTTNLRVKT